MAKRREAPRLCKICLYPNPIDRLVESPCKCRGSMGWVHLDCLTKWLNTSATTSCEICKHKYSFRIHRRSGYLMLIKLVMLSIIYVGLYNEPSIKDPVESLWSDILWLISKVLVASLFVDWVFLKLGLQHDTRHSIIALDLK